MIQWIWVLGLETNLIFSLHHPGHLESWKNWKETLGHPGHSGRNLLAAAAAKSLQLCPTLCDPIDGGLLGSSVPGILQARILEWVAIAFCLVKLALPRFSFCLRFT